MATAYDRIKEIGYIAAAAASVYANPASTVTCVRQIILHNNNTTAETVLLYNVPDSTGSAGTASDANKFYEDAIIADDTIILDFGIPGIIMEDTNDTIQATTTTASKVTIQIYGSQAT